MKRQCPGSMSRADARVFDRDGVERACLCYLGMAQDETAMELSAKRSGGTTKPGAVHKYQVVLANIGKVYLYRDRKSVV